MFVLILKLIISQIQKIDKLVTTYYNKVIMSSKIMITIVLFVLALLVGVGVSSAFANLNPLKDYKDTASIQSYIIEPTSSSRSKTISSIIINKLQSISVTTSAPANNLDSLPINQTKTFSTTQLASYNTQSSCYVSVLSKVYDVTAYISQHPGGSEILRGCGKVLDGMRHPGGSYTGEKIQGILKDYYVGDLKQ